ncbi:MAG: ATP-dependent Clp protease ATP-binding subunit, partial [Oscillospiraceae bacterium]|nr:ATP-dependent Clp protease ATP-binding subunit [Oscillospiraceae bacterium]
MCSKCGKYPAVVYITKMENNKTTNEGLCLKCAKDLGIAPINEMVTNMMDKFGIDEDDLDSISMNMAGLMSSINDIDNIDDLSNPESSPEFNAMLDRLETSYNDSIENQGGAPTAPFDIFNKLFGGKNSGDDVSEHKEKRENKRSEKNVNIPKKKKNGMLDTYGTNLTAKASMGEIDRVINRNSEIDRVIQILNRRSKNNPVLLGEPGVGKTAIAEGLALRIFEKNVPVKLFGYQLYLIDFTALVAGTQFRGQFEARLKNLLTEAQKMGNVILVIDEIHNIVAAGDAEGAMSAANILKPALARGEVQVIGATTLTEYRKHIEKDSALERRFQPVLVDEPSVAESIEILKGVKDYYENFHRVKISDEVIETAVRMSERYITDRFLPDKAIDIIDEAGSKVNLMNRPLYEAARLRDNLDKIRSEMETASSNEDFERAAQLKSEEINLSEHIKKLESDAANYEITKDDVAAVIESWTKIPVHRLTEDEAAKLLDLENRIHKRIVGQDKAVSLVANAIRRRRADISKQKRPVSFIFAGSTGIGKTELVKTIAEVMFDNEEALIRIDMSEYMEKHSVSKLIGSPPGYVGYDDAGQLTEKVRRKPYSVILLDEIEKADPEVFNMFLQILDDGRIADSHGKIINFENTIIVMTTNAGSEMKSNALGFVGVDEDKIQDNVQKSLKNIFKPEFLNRIDDIVTFRPLSKDELKQIIDLLLVDISDCMTERGAKLVVTDSAKDTILKDGYDPKYGARPLKRSIQKLVEDK